MNKATNKEKGDSLEEAVAAIESYIFSVQPGLREASITFERNKILDIKGAKSEVDLIATAEFGKDLKAVFLFECKNWNKKVSKNEIIVFSEKVEELKAQKGFFIAKSFTRDAIGRALNDGRIDLVKVKTEFSIESIPIGYYSSSIVSILLEVKGKEIPKGTVLNHATIIHDGRQVSLLDFKNGLLTQMQDEIYQVDPGLMLKEHTFTREKIFDYEPGQLKFDNKTADGVKATIKLETKAITPVVQSKFDVEKRGRHYTVLFHDKTNNLLMTTSFSQLN